LNTIYRHRSVHLLDSMININVVMAYWLFCI